VRILVTGGAGYIGSIVCEQLIEASHQVVVLDDLSQGHRGALTESAAFVQGDIGDRQGVRDLLRSHGIEAVMHFAALTVVERSVTEPAAFFRENVAKALVLLDTMLECGVQRLVFSSTAAVYGEPQQIPITESHPEIPINAYGESKLMFEKILRWYHRAYGLKYVAVRYFNAAGASRRLGEDHSPESHLIPIVLDAARGNRPHVAIYGSDYPTPDGTCLRDFVHVQDIGSAHLRALERIDGIGHGVFNLGTGVGHSVLQVIETARRVTGRDISVVRGPRRIGDPAVLVASPERAVSQLGWRIAQAELDEIIGSAWAWMQAHPEGYATR